MKSPALLLLGLTAVSFGSELSPSATPPKGVSSSDSHENPFDVKLTGLGVK